MKRMIVTGFEPFGPYKFNPSQESSEFFDAQKIGSHEIVGIVLRCTYLGAFQILKNAIAEIEPTAVISVGLSSGVKGIRFETTGRNIMNGKYPDADGYQPNGIRICEGSAEFIAANSDSTALANRVYQKGIPTEISANAEGFICNSLLYLTSHYIQKNRPKIRNVFIHTPWTANFGDRVSLETGKIMIPLQELHGAIEEIIKGVSAE